MDKYAGMNKVDSKVSENNEVINGKAVKSGNFFKTFFIQIVVALFVGIAVFSFKIFGIKSFSIDDKIKEAVCFDAFDYISEIIEESRAV